MVLDKGGKVLAAGVAVVSEDGMRVLLGKRTDGQGWCFPAGKMDKDDNMDFEVTARRELYEEAGLMPRVLKPVGFIEVKTLIHGAECEVKSMIFKARVSQDYAEYGYVSGLSLIPNAEISEFRFVDILCLLLDHANSYGLYKPTIAALNLLAVKGVNC
ncbi:MAG: NUDIX hydrolase [Bacteroidia bacterium]|nr:NUDIX hydrolase [Bacteroidia bacterium]